MDLSDNAEYRKGDELALAIFCLAMVLWVFLVPGLGWVMREVGLPYWASLPLYQPEARVPTLALEAPGLVLAATGLVVAFSERSVYRVLVRVRYPYNPLSYEEFVGVLDWARDAPPARVDDGGLNHIRRKKTLSRAVMGAPLGAVLISLYASSFALLSFVVVLWAPVYAVALFSDAFARGWSPGRAIHGLFVLLLTAYFFAYLYFWVTYLIRRRGLNRNLAWAAVSALGAVVGVVGALVG